jgi:hypothetical protein
MTRDGAGHPTGPPLLDAHRPLAGAAFEIEDIGSTAARPAHCMFRRMRRSRSSGRSPSTTTRRAASSKPAPIPTARRATTSSRTRTAPSTCTSVRRRPRASPKRTGSRRSRTRAGSLISGSMARRSPISTRAGSCPTSSFSKTDVRPGTFKAGCGLAFANRHQLPKSAALIATPERVVRARIRSGPARGRLTHRSISPSPRR